uniref:Aminoacyl-transfer RNA synthetases class-II family profile domain-containing protein n=1 Tax=Chromera velia CCMP2878 TaxID=1169474 RepID=A0A0G4H585_9ALVE|eukprot:Cvel_5705.t1-p1 / transcript=Cvel_5705.t1 / gene=Cvel_5705 / organism=Chromera_velia_CCMP2878 / gene_product=Aspartate--ammonia ligase, putative / transcript_product=Aspartate--ammonia ligase, putative / location=Cvel_scaffold270:24927-26099(-) / protein_length=391 / sequence_SO=supercontig / SO=protein_coding / is_pseudo=false
MTSRLEDPGGGIGGSDYSQELPMYCPEDQYMPGNTLAGNYRPVLRGVERMRGVSEVKRTFAALLSKEFNLLPHVSPLAFVTGTGINDDLDGSELKSSVKFRVPNLKGSKRGIEVDLSTVQETHGFDAEVVQSLAKWKRCLCKKYGLCPGEGLVCDSLSIRKGYFGDPTHSNICDQWDWELVITKEQRTLVFLHSVVRRIWRLVKETEREIRNTFPQLKHCQELPEEIRIITAEDLHATWPEEDVHGRENRAVNKWGAIFIQGMGWPMRDGSPPEEVRAPDYDDWNLNGDIIVQHPVTGYRHELSSMGIRVDSESLPKQLAHRRMEDRLQLPYHSSVMSGEVPLTIGGGIGISRLAMLLLQTGHIGEVQAGVWHPRHVQEAQDAGMDVIPSF